MFNIEQIKTYDQCKKEFIKKIENLSSEYRAEEVFTDFVEYVALSFHCNLILPNEAKKHQAEIERIRKKYPENFYFELLQLIGKALNDKFGDFLGECYHLIEAQNKNKGQFFTPYVLSLASAKNLLNVNYLKTILKDKGYISINEPSCGGGGMLIAICQILKENDINYQKDILVIAQDVDYRCAYMCYITMCSLGIPAIINIGNSLQNETKLQLKTPFYWLNVYKFKNNKKDNQKVL